MIAVFGVVRVKGRSRTTQRRLSWAGVILASAGLILSGTPLAHAEPWNEDGSGGYAPALPDEVTPEDVAFDTNVSEAVRIIRGLHDGNGLGAFDPDRDRGILTVKWKSPVPDEVRDLDGRQMNGLTVQVQAVPLSQEDLLAVSERLLEASRAGAIPHLAVVTGNPQLSGVTVEVTRGVLDAVGATDLERTLGTITDVAISVVEGSDPFPTTRQNDSNPWFGGGMMEAPGFNPPDDLDPYLFCSVGFATVTSAGAGRLLSARHCDPAPQGGNVCDRAWKDGAHDDLTNGGADVVCHGTDDTMLIDPIGGTGGWVHGGPWNATSSHSRYHLKVAGSDSPVQDQKVCSSGANSGEHCGLEVVNQTLASWLCGPSICNGWRARVPEPSTQVSNVGGDSGGPVYMNRTDGRVGARGIIWGGARPTSCGSVRFPVSNCSTLLYFNDIEHVLDQWSGKGLSIETTT